MTSNLKPGYAGEYDWLIDTKCSEKWRRIGAGRRAGVCIPLFSVYSENSTGIGEFKDLKTVIDWCRKAGLSVLQLLPLNEVGSDFSPYSALSTFALEPMYLTISEVKGFDKRKHSRQLAEIRKQFPAGNQYVDYGIKSAKLGLLREIFGGKAPVDPGFEIFMRENVHWLRYHALFKMLSGRYGTADWSQWDLTDNYFSPASLKRLESENSEEIMFQYWLQWQAFLQLRSVKAYAKDKKVLIMGDLPFLVSGSSADVWAYKNYFKLHLSSGAPPDMYFAKGQKWGMPPYDWDNIRADGYSYIKSRLKYAENFYDMYRIDHFVGLFRVWTMPAGTADNSGGRFDPPHEHLWMSHGEEIVSAMAGATAMLPCAEDLGTVPACSDVALKEYGIPGMNVQRWEKKISGFAAFIRPQDYRTNSNAVISTHDSSSFPYWLDNEAGTVDMQAFILLCEDKGYPEQRINEIISRLFTETDPQNSRLRWKPDISNVFVLIEILEAEYNDVQDIVATYLSSFKEKETFLSSIGVKKPVERITPSLVRRNLSSIFSSRSIFSIQLLHEYLYLDRSFLKRSKYMRINSPGTISAGNWSETIRLPLNVLREKSCTETLLKLVKESGRIQ